MKAFLLTGHFGPFTRPISRQQLRAILGPPDLFGDVPKRQQECYACAPDGTRTHIPPLEEPNADDAGIWKYGSFEFYFGDDQLSMIFADHFNRLRGGRRIRLSPWRLRGQAERLVIQDGLEQLGIGYHVSKATYDPTQMLVRTDSGVQLSFIEKYERFFAPVGLCAVSRQWE